MRRHWSQRFLGMLGAVWFILVGIEPAAFGACPAHGAAGVQASHAGHAMLAAMDHASMQHAANAGHDASAPGHDQHQCTCPGSCCGPSIVNAPSTQLALPILAVIGTTPRVVEHRERSAWTDHVLPFGTAPPSVT